MNMFNTAGMTNFNQNNQINKLTPILQSPKYSYKLMTVSNTATYAGEETKIQYNLF